MADTATLTAEDVRRQVTEPWCQQKQEVDPTAHIAPWTRPGLWTRCRDCRPDGLEWMGERKLDYGTMIVGWRLDGKLISVAAAIALILHDIAQSGTAAYCKEMRFGQWVRVYYDLTDAVMHGDLPAAVAARHRLLDLQEQNDE